MLLMMSLQSFVKSLRDEETMIPTSLNISFTTPISYSSSLLFESSNTVEMFVIIFIVVLMHNPDFGEPVH